ncbi:MAG: GNAT family N-acetyltransferase [Caldilineaceae bacterium]
MNIRPAQLKDAPAMARVMVDTYLTAHHGQIPEAAWQKRKDEWGYAESEAGWRRSISAIADDGEQMCICVAVNDRDEVVGVVVGHPTETPQVGELSALYVRPEAQGQGIGRQLVQAAAAHLAAMGCTELHIATLAANAPARRFYEAIGGTVVGEREFDEEGVLLPEVVYGWPDIEVFLTEP